MPSHSRAGPHASSSAQTTTSNVINRPDPQVLFSPSGKSKLARTDMIQRYEEWLKIASENVRIHSL